MRFLLILIISLFAMPEISTAENSSTLAIIVTPELNIKTLTKSELALIYWRKKQFWSNGHRIQAVNFSVENPTRNQFSKLVLDSLPETQTDYWNGLYFHGVSPPHVVKSYEAAIRFVAETDGAIAYIPACLEDERVKTLAWLDENGQLKNTPPSCNK